MYAFRYHHAGSIDEAVRLHGSCEDPGYLAGGHTLLPTLKMRLAQPSDLIDLGTIDALKNTSTGTDTLIIGAGVRHNDVARMTHPIPALAGLAGQIGDFQVRNRGTLGGSIANADPAADYPAALVGLGATVITDRRQIAADDFFVDLFETALQEGELVTSVAFPAPRRAAYMKFPNPASRYAIVGVFVAWTASGMRVAVTGAGARVFRVAAMEEALERNFSPDVLADIQIPDDGLNSDIHATPDYRAHLVTVMARRAVALANA
ncbi:MAG: xanthine dehydrogenase family protein subunit M [bacterium]|nr:xanthine dehydrogenase family protein subunit M [bacterium]MDE0239022.1 xanthine dehydrogenase family protein subunit M [bacterium]MDE0416373.1 xanthine dehydrogenase family protein subunit M [bacterium]